MAGLLDRVIGRRRAARFAPGAFVAAACPVRQGCHARTGLHRTSDPVAAIWWTVVAGRGDDHAGRIQAHRLCGSRQGVPASDRRIGPGADRHIHGRDLPSHIFHLRAGAFGLPGAAGGHLSSLRN